jgi:glucan-binding YG repeat protein/beta-lactamase superfamily II metal-dependent hydrolase
MTALMACMLAAAPAYATENGIPQTAVAETGTAGTEAAGTGTAKKEDSAATDAEETAEPLEKAAGEGEKAAAAGGEQSVQENGAEEISGGTESSVQDTDGGGETEAPQTKETAPETAVSPEEEGAAGKDSEHGSENSGIAEKAQETPPAELEGIDTDGETLAAGTETVEPAAEADSGQKDAEPAEETSAGEKTLEAETDAAAGGGEKLEDTKENEEKTGSALAGEQETPPVDPHVEEVVEASVPVKKAAAVAKAAEQVKSMVLKVIDYDGRGYGDGQMLSSRNKNLLIDTYVKESWGNVNSWLKGHGYTNFDIYISHYHDDHMDNVTRILNDGGYNVSRLYLPNPDYMTGSSTYMKNYISMYKNMISTAKSRGVQITYLKKGSSFSIGDVSAKVLWGTDYSSGSHDTHYINNNSLVTRFTCGNTRYLNAGDIEAATERQILNAKIDVKADILKLSHHGGDTSNTEAFIRAVDPSFCYYNYTGDSPSRYAGDDRSSWANRSVKTAEKYANVSSVRYNGDITYRIYDDVIAQELERNYTQQKVYIYDKTRRTELKGIVTQSLNKRSRKHTESCAAKAGYTSSLSRRQGTRSNDGWLIGNGSLQYYVKNNTIQKGWKKIGGSLYHFNEKTGIKDTGWKVFGKNRFYFWGSGKAAMGFAKIGSKTYHFDENGRQTKTGWRTIGGKRYCFGSNNEVLFGIRKIGNKKYIFSAKTGEMLTGPVVYNGKRYLCDKNGVLQTGGWKVYNGKKYYIDPRTGYRLAGGFKKIGGKIYYFESSGVLTSRTGFTRIGGKTYYVRADGSVKTGWLGVSGKLYYMGSDGIMRTGRQKINGKTFRFSSDGVRL